MKIIAISTNRQTPKGLSFTRMKSRVVKVKPSKNLGNLEASLMGLSALALTTVNKNKDSSELSITPSQIVGEYEMKQKSGENEESFATVNVDSKGNFNIERNLISTKKIKSLYKKIGNNDNYEILYKIIDKQGNLLLDINRKFHFPLIIMFCLEKL